eukprot:8532374-Lingulodinium_polyedra.AAC.1
MSTARWGHAGPAGHASSRGASRARTLGTFAATTRGSSLKTRSASLSRGWRRPRPRSTPPS